MSTSKGALKSQILNLLMEFAGIYPPLPLITQMYQFTSPSSHRPFSFISPAHHGRTTPTLRPKDVVG
jgi:hypothetical protein